MGPFIRIVTFNIILRATVVSTGNLIYVQIGFSFLTVMGLCFTCTGWIKKVEFMN